jgi:spore maturation protein CgeB
MKIRHSQTEVLAGNGHGTAVVDGSSPLDTKSLLTPPRSLLGRSIEEPSRPRFKIVVLGPSLTSSFGKGDVATYRGLVRDLTVRGHEVFSLERSREGGVASPRQPDSGRVDEYSSLKELKDRHPAAVRDADIVLVGSQIPEASSAGDWVTRQAQGVTVFYDLNSPGTIAGLNRNSSTHISAELISRYHLYLSSTGGPLLDQLEDHYGSPMARPLYPAVDARLFFPESAAQNWDLGYLGGHCTERQPAMDRLLLEPARLWGEGRFVVSGSKYPSSMRWPKNVKRIPHVPPQKRRAFFNSQRFALIITPPELIAIGHSPSARLFEAAACGIPAITEFWPGLDTFFKPDEEILISHSADETLVYLEEISELERRRLGYRARERVLARHTSRHRAAELEGYVLEILKR